MPALTLGSSLRTLQVSLMVPVLANLTRGPPMMSSLKSHGKKYSGPRIRLQRKIKARTNIKAPPLCQLGQQQGPRMQLERRPTKRMFNPGNKVRNSMTNLQHLRQMLHRSILNGCYRKRITKKTSSRTGTSGKWLNWRRRNKPSLMQLLKL